MHTDAKVAVGAELRRWEWMISRSAIRYMDTLQTSRRRPDTDDRLSLCPRLHDRRKWRKRGHGFIGTYGNEYCSTVSLRISVFYLVRRDVNQRSELQFMRM